MITDHFYCTALRNGILANNMPFPVRLDVFILSRFLWTSYALISNKSFSVEILTYTAISPTHMQLSWPWVALMYNDALENLVEGFPKNVVIKQTRISDETFKDCEDLTAQADFLVAERYYKRSSVPNVTVMLYSVLMSRQSVGQLVQGSFTHGCTETLNLNRLAAGWNILHYTSTVATDVWTQNHGFAPTWITSSILSYASLEQFVADLFRMYQWKSVLLLLDRTEFANQWFIGAAEAVASSIYANIPDSQIYRRLFTDAKKANNTTDMDFLAEARQYCRIIMFFGNTDNLRRILAEATKLNMANGEYVFLTVEPYPHTSWGNYSWQFHDDLDTVLEKIWRSLLVITLAKAEIGRIRILAPRFPIWKARAKEIYHFNISDDEEINFSQLSAYEAMSILLKVLREAVLENPLRDWSNGIELADRFHNRTVYLPTGPVKFNDKGSRSVNLLLQDYNTTTARLEPVLLYDSLLNTVETLGPIDWPYRVSPPPNAPICGFSGGLCRYRDYERYIAFGSSLAAILILVVILIFAFRKYMRTKKELASRRWELNKANLSYPNARSLIRNNGSIQSIRLKRRSSPTGCRPLVLGERRSNLSVYTIEKDEFRGEMSYNQQQVWAKEIPCVYSLEELPRSVLKLLARLVGLYHQNVNTFIGICTAYDGVSLLILDDYCKRGSLRDILGTQKPDPELKKSFIQDLIFGLRFIHDSVVENHGFLTSSCCLIDGRFTLKIAKLGQQKVTKLISGSQKLTNSNAADIYWTAPECVLEQKARLTQKCDIYSMAIILTEIFMGTLIFSLTPEELYEQITIVNNTSCRPFIDRTHIPEDLIPVLRSCWHVKPRLRPTIQQAQSSIFRKLNISGRDKLVDKMIKRLQNYAEDLEHRVYERTLELQREQQQSDSLLCEVFPESIVQRLRSRKLVQPEMFEKATVYFSDIIGFDEIVKTKTPYEVIHFLSYTYATFDQVIPSFDVYKVETINDSYLVASGIPVRNNDKHAVEISGMACQLMKCYRKSLFRDETHLRIGIHSGPVAAGIVGTKSPRYCLFGDTMNTASRMESHGEAGRIHLSDHTAAYLLPLPQFVILPRGLTFIKGKGEMQTFWLEWRQSD